jgi:hypothetical protein
VWFEPDGFKVMPGPQAIPRGEMTRKIVKADATNVAQRWREQYFKRGEWYKHLHRGSAEHIYNALLALGENPSVDRVDEIVGNKDWTHISCSVCHEYVDVAVEGPYDDQNDSYDYLCRPCVVAALNAFSTPAESSD